MPVDYDLLTMTERVVMGLIVVATNAAAIPIIVVLLRNPHAQFEGLVAFMSGFTSFMYHCCEVFNRDIYLSELEWHRLDNVFVTSGISIFVMHILGNKQSRILIYCTLLGSILSQEKYPWDIRFTIAPILIFCLIGVLCRFATWDKVEVTYNRGYLGRTAVLLAIGGYFFLKGLDENDDYLRFNHGMWHLFSGAGIYFGLQACSVK